MFCAISTIAKSLCYGFCWCILARAFQSVIDGVESSRCCRYAVCGDANVFVQSFFEMSPLLPGLMNRFCRCIFAHTFHSVSYVVPITDIANTLFTMRKTRSHKVYWRFRRNACINSDIAKSKLRFRPHFPTSISYRKELQILPLAFCSKPISKHFRITWYSCSIVSYAVLCQWFMLCTNKPLSKRSCYFLLRWLWRG